MTNGTSTLAGRRLAAATSFAVAIVVLLSVAAPRASAEQIPSALGIPCSPGSGGVQKCTGSMETRVPSWDGVPLDVNLTFPPAEQSGPHPLIVYLHGWGGSKDSAAVNVNGLAQRGYAVMAYSARGFGDSCGAEESRNVSGCARGWIHLSDARFEARDTQHLAGLLVDAGLVEPRIGVTGDSYGGGQSMILAALRNRVMLPEGRLVRWRSPDGTPMAIAAAAPRIGWSDLAYALTPNGGTLDFRSHNPYRLPAGVAKESYLSGLFLTGQLSGFYAPPGEDPDAEHPRAVRPHPGGGAVRLESRAAAAPVADEAVPLGVLRRAGRSEAQAGQPGAAADLQRVDGRSLPRRRGDPVREARPVAPSRGRGLDVLRRWVRPPARGVRRHSRDRGGTRRPLRPSPARRSSVPKLPGVQTYTQGCGVPDQGPFTSRNWRKQHPGEVDFSTDEAKSFTSEGGDEATANARQPDRRRRQLPQRRRGRRSGCRDVPAPGGGRGRATR